MVALVAGRGTTSAHFFAPCYQAGISDSTPGAGADIVTVFGVGIGPDCQLRTGDEDPAQYNFGAVIGFTPPEWTVPADADIPDGTQVGQLFSVAVLGLLNNPCNTTVSVDFKMLDGTTDRSNPIDANPPGTPDRLNPLAQDSNGNGIPDAADRWPSYLSDVFEDVDLSKLRARLVGVNTTQVSGTTVVLNFLIFEPGAKVQIPGTSLVLDVDPRLGYPSVTALQDQSAPVGPQDPINDFCSPLFTTTTTFGDFRTNPADGAYNFVVFTASQLDADEDGIENALDPCNLTPDPDWDPRGSGVQKPGDRDGDGVPDVCDPNPDQPSTGTAGVGVGNSDEDGDGWMNRNDNCAVDANPDQADADGDAVGDVCDPNPSQRTGHFHLVCTVSVIQVGAGGTPAVNPQDVQPCNPNAPLPSSDTGSGQQDDQPGGTGPGDETAGEDGAGGTGTAVLGEEAVAGGPGAAAGPASGVGSLAPAVSSVPTWAAVLTGLGGAGLLGLAARFLAGLRRKR